MDAADLVGNNIGGNNARVEPNGIVAPTTQCIKAEELRKKGFDNFPAWLGHPNSLYVGRIGRIFVNRPEGNIVFHYKGSIWANPFVLSKNGITTVVLKHNRENLRASKYSLQDSLARYEAHIRTTLWERLDELNGKVLGCFCKQGNNNCHAQILTRLWREKNNIRA